MTYCMGNMSEPESVSVIPGEQKYLIPTIVARLNDREEWCVGDEALLRKSRGEAEAAEDILKCILAEKNIIIAGSEYTGQEILNIYFNGLFNILRNNYHITKPDKLVVTIEYPDRLLVNLIRNVLVSMGFEKDDIKIIGHSESLIYYTIFQKKELWVNDVLVFDFNEKQFLMRRLTTLRARSPQPIVVEETDLSQKFKMSSLATAKGREETDNQFYEVLKELCEKHIVSTVYLTGIGFYEKWLKKSIDYLCIKRRVFQGYNLFVKGAGYANLSRMGIGNAKDYQFVCSGRTLVDIELEIEKEDKKVMVMLSKAGTNWYEAGARAEGILNDTKEIKLKVISSVSKNNRDVCIELRGFPPRPNKTTRVEIVLAYKNERQCIIQVKDMGFGDFFKASDELVKTVIDIEDYI